LPEVVANRHEAEERCRDHVVQNIAQVQFTGPLGLLDPLASSDVLGKTIHMGANHAASRSFSPL
jgi:hypothetical protein